MCFTRFRKTTLQIAKTERTISLKLKGKVIQEDF